ncbi:MAG: hypothetical protein A2664_00545 [Candidatus Taylorbacteria bacterium RIFCSPHIGHO2_01_FULL_46_22b]|uniref:Nucleotidyl transferase domain-containing protein n=1 Tax=Candidatus Taylorbacteria bacterium RIFCSPHIGHO2_01_FULL_46_22b TaxID=1802301 RepID=A0A1G2M5M7_9BACT|nr:MAG: hypothetical protein A2664_00545 [Candidatus Taylorbacteria bacterium RIFCSPHIGHO2_01_FULL_46_22b]
MKAVILAAGEGKRLRPLTDKIPKPLVHLAGKPLLEHLFEALPPEVDEVILVLGYRGEQIQAHFGEKFGRFKLSYIFQEKRDGTARALALCKDSLGGERFLSLYADDLNGAKDLEELLKHPLSVLVKEVEQPEKFGVVTLNKNGQVADIVEKPKVPPSNLVVTGPAVLDGRIFSYEPPQHENGEYYLAEAIGQLVKDHPVVAVPQSLWIPIGYPEDLAKAEEILKRNKPRD